MTAATQRRPSSYEPDPANAGLPFFCALCGRPHPRVLCQSCNERYQPHPAWLRALVIEVQKLNMRVIRNGRRLKGTASAKDGRYPGVRVVGLEGLERTL